MNSSRHYHSQNNSYIYIKELNPSAYCENQKALVQWQKKEKLNTEQFSQDSFKTSLRKDLSLTKAGSKFGNYSQEGDAKDRNRYGIQHFKVGKDQTLRSTQQ